MVDSCSPEVKEDCCSAWKDDHSASKDDYVPHPQYGTKVPNFQSLQQVIKIPLPHVVAVSLSASFHDALLFGL